MKVISRKADRMVAVAQLACIFGLLLAGLALRLTGYWTKKHAEPFGFIIMGWLGLVFMARYLIYAHPEKPGDMTRAQLDTMPRKRKLLLAVGYTMCAPMFILGVMGMISLETFERAITSLSPMQFLADGAEISEAFVSLLILAGAGIFIGVARGLPRVFWLGINLLVLAVFLGLMLLR